MEQPVPRLRPDVQRHHGHRLSLSSTPMAPRVRGVSEILKVAALTTPRCLIFCAERPVLSDLLSLRHHKRQLAPQCSFRIGAWWLGPGTDCSGLLTKGLQTADGFFAGCPCNGPKLNLLFRPRWLVRRLRGGKSPLGRCRSRLMCVRLRARGSGCRGLL